MNDTKDRPMELPPEPGTVADPSHGIPGPEEALPDGDADNEEGIEI